MKEKIHYRITIDLQDTSPEELQWFRQELQDLLLDRMDRTKIIVKTIPEEGESHGA